MSCSSKFGVLAALLLVGVTPAPAQELPPPTPSAIGSSARTAEHRLDPVRVAALRDFVELAMAELSIPGLAVAVVDQGDIVLEAGYGVRALGRPDPVDAHTLFMIGSNTKSLVTLMMARLVDQGKLQWDEPAVQAFPALRLEDQEFAETLLVRHLVCACAGLPRKDMPWIVGVPEGATASLVFDRLALSSPTSDIGQTYGYSNLMAAAGGYLAGAVAYPELEVGAAFDRGMDELVFRPLGMDDTTFDMERAQAGNFAAPHGADFHGSMQLATLAPNRVIVPYRPAGGAWSSAHDMIRYLALEAGGGILPSGDRLVSASSLLARRTPSVRVSPTATYGLGFVTDTSWDVPVVRHAGSIAGYRSEVTIFPDAQVAAVILTNSGEGRLLLRPFMRRLYELLYDGPLTAEAELMAASASNAQRAAAMRASLSVPVDAAVRDRLVQNYWNNELGTLRVERIGPVVKLHCPLWASEIGSRTNADGTISLALIDPTVAGFELLLRRKGEKDVIVARDGTIEYEYLPVSTLPGKADPSTE